MQRQKTNEELAQEQSDAEFARRLQEEMMAEEQATRQQQRQMQQHRQTQQPSSSPAGASGRITCQFCQSQNNVPSGAGTTQFLCGYCKRVLIFNQPPEISTRNIAAPPPQHPNMPTMQSSQNNGYPAAQQPTSRPNSAPHFNNNNNAVNPSQPIYQGNVQPPANIQVRCGQCTVVNAVPRPTSGSTLQFMCGSCQSVNEVNI